VSGEAEFEVVREVWGAFTREDDEAAIVRIHPGVELEVPATWVVEVRDGKIAFWRTFTDRDEAHRFVGLQD
jgi:ketosteroid isomerase-like protein